MSKFETLVHFLSAQQSQLSTKRNWSPSKLNSIKMRHCYEIYRYIFIIISLTIVLSACNKESGPTVTATSQIQPLEVGNSWLYTDSIFGNSLMVVNLRIEITEKSSEDVYDWSVYRNDIFSYKNLVSKEDEEFIHIATIQGTDTLMSRQTWALYPVQVGDQFDETRFTYDESSGTFTESAVWTWTCIFTDQKLILDGEEYEAVVYETSPEVNQIIRLSYLKDVGYAGWETIEDGKTTFKEVLVSFQLH